MENVIYIFAYNFANVGMKPVCKGWNIFVHLYNKKVLKYGEQDVIFVNLVWVIVEVPLINNRWEGILKLRKLVFSLSPKCMQTKCIDALHNFLELEPQVCESSLEVKFFFRVCPCVRPCIRHKKILVVFGMTLKIRMEIWV